LRAAGSAAGSRDERPGNKETRAGTDEIGLAAGFGDQLCSSKISAEGLSLGTGFDHRGEGIRDCNDPGAGLRYESCRRRA